MKLLSKILSKSIELVSLDKRSLALFRIMLAVTALFDLADRARDLRTHYTDAGPMPRHLVLSDFQNQYWSSIYLISGNTFFVAGLFCINALIALSMMVGYRTTLSTALSWFFVVSLQSRNYLLGHGGDVLHRVVLFFSIFLPLGDCYSVDSALKDYNKAEKHCINKKKKFNYRVASIATVALIVQIMVMYISAHKLKVGKEWTETRVATWLALQLDFFRRPIGDVLMMFPSLCKLFTIIVLEWQGWGPLFYFSPVWTGPLKMFSVLGFFGMHVAFFMSFRLGQFGFITCSAILALIPSWFWDTFVFTRKMRSKERLDLKIYYHEHCKVCGKAAFVIKKFFLIPETQVIARHSLASPHKSDFYSLESCLPVRNWIAVEDIRGNLTYNFDALFELCKLSPILWPVAQVIEYSNKVNWIHSILFTTKGIADAIIQAHEDDEMVQPETHNTQKAHKHQSSDDATYVITVNKIRKYSVSIVKNFVVLVFLLLVVSWNAGNLGYTSYSTPNSLRWLIWSTHLDQSWSMFAPRPPSDDWWYNIDAELHDGRKVELFNHGGLFTNEPNEQKWEKPEIVASFKNHRWFKYFENGVNSHPNNQVIRLNFGRWICREYNSRHFNEDRLHKFTIWWQAERANPYELTTTNVPKQALWNHVCYDK